MKSDERYLQFIADCCLALEVDVEDVLASGKSARAVVEARQFIAWALRDKWGLSYPHLARLLHRDHTTMIASVRKVQRANESRERWALQCAEACAYRTQPTLVTESALESLSAMGAAE